MTCCLTKMRCGARKATLVLLALVLTAIMIPMVALVQHEEAYAASFTMRTDRPAASNKYYYNYSYNPYYTNELAPTGSPCSTGKYVVGNCTWYAWGRAYEITGNRPTFSPGDPLGMLNSAKAANYRVDKTPSAGSLAVYGRDSGGNYHVAVVEKVSGGTVYVSESGYTESWTKPTASTIVFHYGSASDWNAGRELLGYIHLGSFDSHTHSYATTYTYKSYNTHTVTKKCSCGSKSTTTEWCSIVEKNGKRSCSKCGKAAQPYGKNKVLTDVFEGDCYILSATTPSLALSQEDGGTEVGTNICLEKATEASSQMFYVMKNDNGTYSLTNWAGTAGTVVGLSDWTMNNGTNVESVGYWFRKNANNQWYIEKTPDGYYSFRNLHSNLYLDIENGTPEGVPFKVGQNIWQYGGNGSDAQKFLIVRATGKWVSSSEGWWYENADGTYPKSCWMEIDGERYHFDSSGYMQTGWLKSDGSWYYLRSSGEMATGWCEVSGSWYHLSSSGEMDAGWLKSGGSWYYLRSSGEMATGWCEVSGSWYYFGSSGVMQSSRWVGDYYLLSSGEMATSQWVDGGRYYVGADGKWIEGYQG